MNEHSHGAQGGRERLMELLADDRLDQLTPDDRAELEILLAAADNGEQASERIDEAIGRTLVALDALDDSSGMPASVRERLTRRGVAIATEQGPTSIPISAYAHSARPWGWLAAAACLVAATGIGFYAVREIERRDVQLAEARMIAEERISENQSLLADARAELTLIGDRYSAADERRLELLEMLADATSKLDSAEMKIAQYETPEDPAVLAANRTQLLDVNGTIRVAWQPFDVPGMPATEQPGVVGDVVWNDVLQEGYLRFVGLVVNDPAREQYQVWIIDDRGMEQKVSGGVFNATAAGEIIVPIEPGIDVGRVQVFAITVEEPGGIWVPDLKRRVVVAPRSDEG